MDKVIWLIVATAVIIALAGILLFIGADSLSEVGQRFSDILNISAEPENATDDLTGE